MPRASKRSEKQAVLPNPQRRLFWHPFTRQKQGPLYIVTLDATASAAVRWCASRFPVDPDALVSGIVAKEVEHAKDQDLHSDDMFPEAVGFMAWLMMKALHRSGRNQNLHGSRSDDPVSRVAAARS